VRSQLLSCFWSGLSAEKTAERTGVNRKTALAHFRRFRQTIAQMDAAGSSVGGPSGAARTLDRHERTQRTPVFGIREGLRAVTVLMPGEAQFLGGARNPSISWVYAPSAESARDLNLDVFFHIGRQEVVRWHGRAQISRADRFWSFARDWLRAHHGGYRREFGLFLKEAAYRFNARSTPGGLERLKAALG